MNYEFPNAVFKLHYAFLGATSASSGYVKIEVSSTVPGTNASLGSLEKEWALALSAPTSSSEETIFLSPL